jgi:hypothetical protein
VGARRGRGGWELVEVVDGGDEGEIVGAEGREGTGDERVDVGEGEREAFAVDVVAVLVVCERSPGEGDVRGVRGEGDVPKPVTGRVASFHFPNASGRRSGRERGRSSTTTTRDEVGGTKRRTEEDVVVSTAQHRLRHVCAGRGFRV